MKKLSIARIIAALLIVNCYMFTCGVMGNIGGAAMVKPENSAGTAEADGVQDIGEADGQGTMDFLVPDETTTGYVEMHLLNMAPTSLSGKMVQSTFSVSSEPQQTPEELPPEDTEEIFGSTAEEDATYEPSTDEIYITLPKETVEEPVPVQTTARTTVPTTVPTTAATTTTTKAATEKPVEVTTTTMSTAAIPVDDPAEESSKAPASDDQPDEIQMTEDSSSEEITEETSDSSGEILYVTSSGGTVSGTALEIVGRITQNEIGHTFAPEAIKAQAVAAYTYVKFCNEYGTYPSVGLASTVSDAVNVLVNSVIGKAVYYNDSLIQAVYSSSSAGYTASSKTVWGTEYPYLESRFCDLDKQYDPNYGKTAKYSSEQIKSRVLEKTGIELSGDPSGWLEIEERVDGNYVGQMSVGGYHSYTDSDGDSVKITGRVFRERIMSFDLRSSAFDIAYDPDADEFTFTTYGYGHGVGMSQNGANALATYLGYDYTQILTYYYQGTEVR